MSDFTLKKEKEIEGLTKHVYHTLTLSSALVIVQQGGRGSQSSFALTLENPFSEQLRWLLRKSFLVEK